MVTLLEQCLASSFLLLFGMLALRVWRRSGPVRRDRATLAWGVSAAYFLVGGAYSFGHSVLSAAAVAWGSGSPLYGWVGGRAIAANLARGVVATVFGGLLVVLLTAPRRQALRASHGAVVTMLVTSVLATAVLLQFPVRTVHGHNTGLAVLSMLTAILIMAALLAAVLNDGMDQLLWLSLALYALKETLSVSQLAVIAFWAVAPHAEVFHFFYGSAVVLGAGMCAFAVRRLRLAGAGRRVPAVFERLHALRSPAS